MSHAICTQGNWVDSWLWMVESQTANLTLDLSFGHNLCFRCPNESCEPILDIYISIYFQWYKDLLNAMGFDPCNRPLNILGIHWDSNSQNGSPLGSVWVHSLTPPTLPGAWNVINGLHSRPTPLQVFALVASPRLRSQHYISLIMQKKLIAIFVVAMTTGF